MKPDVQKDLKYLSNHGIFRENCGKTRKNSHVAWEIGLSGCFAK
jgi:hypothetical protein